MNMSPINRQMASTLAGRLPVVTEPLSQAAESIRGLRTHIVARHIGAGRRALSVCAPNKDAGTTFVAANLAAALAQAGMSTLLVDADMRSPGVARAFGCDEAAPGLKQYLSGTGAGDFAEIVSSSVPGLSLLLSGGVASNAQELLAGPRFRALIDACTRDYQFMIVDAPPASQYADAGLIAHVVSYCLVVARRNATYVSDMNVLIRQLRADNAVVVGTILNSGP